MSRVKLGPLLQRIRMDPELAKLTLGSVLESDGVREKDELDRRELALLCLADWLAKFSGLPLHPVIIPLLHRLEPSISDWAIDEDHDVDDDIANITIYDYRYVACCGLPRPYDALELRIVGSENHQRYAEQAVSVLKCRLGRLVQLVEESMDGSTARTQEGPVHPAKAAGDVRSQ